MLQPRNYPNLLGQAAVLEDRPFIVMVNDDNPWAEGLMLTVTVGIFVGIAQLLGGLLTAAALPSSSALLVIAERTLQQLWPDGSTALIADLQQQWGLPWLVFNLFYGLDGEWLRLLVLVWTPLGFVLQWLVSGVLVHLIARGMGGQGDLNRTLGATALMVMPMTLRLLTIVPFVTINVALIAVWSTLIIYRALEVAHDLPWRKAALIALAPAAAFLFAVFAGEAIVLGLLSVTRGGG